MPKRQLSEEALALIAQRFKVLGDPLRLGILHSLLDSERNVTDLVQMTGANQANVSRHLATLTRSGILKRRKQGLHVFYSIADPSVLELCEVVCNSVEAFYSQKASAFK